MRSRGMVFWNDTALPTSVAGGERRPASLLRWQRPDELHRSLNPAPQLVVVLDALRGDQHPARHRPPGDIELADVRFLERLVAFLRAEADDERILPDADQHVAVHQEADAAEHLLLLDVLAPGH